MKIRNLCIFVILLASVLLAGCAATAQPTNNTVAVPDMEMAAVSIYFFSAERFAVGTEPYEIEVTRQFHPDANLPYLALQAYFDGPTASEADQGLSTILSGCTGVSALTIENGIARVYLEGPCTSGGSTYTIATPITKTLLQFNEIQFVKIYDANGITEAPSGPSNSIPFVLEP
ncbi:GerMN domain-containing protein [bacterium]|nr:GerMN domain-containing protein [bacterium]